MSPWWIVFRKELRETLRDRRTLLMMVVIPVLLYPVLLVVSEQILLFGMRRISASAAPVAVVGDAPPDLLAMVDSSAALRRVTLSADPAEALRLDSVTAVAVLGPEPADTDATRAVTVLYDATSDRSQRGNRELSRVLSAWRDTLLARRLRAQGLPVSFARPLAVADSSVAPPQDVGRHTLGRILPMLLVIITLLGTFYPAIDLAAGEKERATLETLLTAPVPSGAVVAGKFVTVALIGVVAAALNLGSMLLTFQTGVLQMANSAGLDVSLPAGSVAVIFLTLVPLSILFGALFLGIAVRSASFKEAQNSLTPVYMLVVLPAMLPLFPGLDFNAVMAVVPVAGVSFFFRDLMVGDAHLTTGALVVGSTVVYAVAALTFAARAFGSEDVLFGGSDNDAEVTGEGWWSRARRRAATGATPTPRAAVFFVAAVAVIFFWGGITLQVRLGEKGLLLSEWLLLLGPALLFVRAWGYDAKRTLSLRAPSGRGLLAAVFLVGGALPVGWLIGWLQTFVLPVPWELLEGLEKLVTAQSPGRLAWLILLLAVTPAVCEEMVFRGVLLGGTRELATWRVVLLNGLVFGAFHLTFQTAIRFLPTAWLGIVIAWAVLRTRSLWVGSVMHFLNNGTIVLLASVPALRDMLSDPNAPPPAWALPLAALSLYAGVRLLSSQPAADTGSPNTSSEDE